MEHNCRKSSSCLMKLNSSYTTISHNGCTHHVKNASMNIFMYKKYSCLISFRGWKSGSKFNGFKNLQVHWCVSRRRRAGTPLWSGELGRKWYSARIHTAASWRNFCWEINMVSFFFYVEWSFTVQWNPLPRPITEIPNSWSKFDRSIQLSFTFFMPFSLMNTIELFFRIQYVRYQQEL